VNYLYIFSMLKVNKIFFILVGLILLAIHQSCRNEQNVNKKELFVREKLNRLDLEEYSTPDIIPTDSCAVQVAEIILRAFYGKEIETEKPFRVGLYQDSIWIIKGNFPREDRTWRGGVAHIEIRKSDGKILRIYHGN
jgi:hypothetical protein